LTSVIASLPAAGEAISYSYDALNRITRVTTQGKNIAYEYDPVGNRTKLTYPDATYLTYIYDQLNRLTSVSSSSLRGGAAGADEAISSYTYDALSRRTGLTYANNTRTTYTYDAANRLLSLRGATPSEAKGSDEAISYTYDNVGNRLTSSLRATEGSEAISTYTYDKLYQLANVDYPDNLAFNDTAFNYDSLGNRLSTVNSGTTNYAPNYLNQYTRVGETNYTYDLNGNLINDGAQSYDYDYENRLTRVTPTPPQTSAIYTYDPFGRRIRSSLRGAVGDEAISYLYDGDQIIAEYDNSGSLIAKYIYGPGIDEPICKIGTVPEGGLSLFYYHFDGLGSVTQITDNRGQITERYEYDAFGKPAIKDASGATLQASSIGNRFMFTGREYDQETGLYYYRARHYSPTLGRFLQRDPLGNIDGPNPYTYCANNPINWIDPFGLCKDKPWWQKLEEGYYYGTGYGEEAAEWYAQQQIATGNPLWAIPGSIASLWTPETYQNTGWTLITAYQIGTYLGRPYYQYYPAGNEGYASPYLTRGRGFSQPFKTGAEAAEKLSLPPYNPGTAVRTVRPNPFRYIKGPERVIEEFGRSGGGTQYIFK